MLSHETKLKYLAKILEQNELKSSALSGSLNQGSGIYDKSNEIYFRAVKNIKDITRPEGNVILFFNSKILYNKPFWISTTNSADTDTHTKSTWNIKWKNDPQYSMKYKRHYKYVDKALKKLYLHSVSAGHPMIIYNSVTVLNKINIKEHLVAIVLTPSVESKKEILEKYIKKHYPHTKIYAYSDIHSK
jgi:hypothetical protein